jgi:hypothetical protein
MSTKTSKFYRNLEHRLDPNQVSSTAYLIDAVYDRTYSAEQIYGNNTWMTADYPVKFTVTGGDNAWGTELMLYCGDTIASGSAVRSMSIDNMYIVSIGTAAIVNVVEFLYGEVGDLIDGIVCDDSDDDFELAGNDVSLTLVTGDKVIVDHAHTTSGINTYTVYYVINSATVDHFQLSLTDGGVAVVLGTGDGTCALRKLTQTSLTKTCISLPATSNLPVPIKCPRIGCDQRLFVRAKSATGSTIAIGFLLGLHTYDKI